MEEDYVVGRTRNRSQGLTKAIRDRQLARSDTECQASIDVTVAKNVTPAIWIEHISLSLDYPFPFYMCCYVLE